MERQLLKDRILEELKVLKDIRRETEPDRGMAASLVYPRRKQFEQHKLEKVFTAKGKSALNTSVLGLMGNMVSSSVDWFDLEADIDEDPDTITGLNDWLEKLRDKIKNEFEVFGMYQNLQLALRDACAQGTSAMLVLDNASKKSVRYQVVPPQQFYIKDDEDGKPERFYREYEMTAIDALEFFGDENCPEIKRMYDEDPYSKHTIIHAIFPRRERDPFSLNNKNKAFASIYFSETDDKIVRESGFDNFPVIIHRWTKDTASPYGGCPTLDCIESLKIYSKAWNNMLKQDDLMTNPPTVAPTSLRGRFSMRPGAVNYVDNIDQHALRPLYNGANYQVMKDSLETIMQEIDSAFHTDYFKLLVNRDKQMTAREVIEVLGERASILVPVVERMQAEVMGPLVLRHYEIMQRGERVPEPPTELSKKKIKLKIQVMGPLSQAMKKYHQAEGLMRSLEAGIPFIQQFPAAEDNLDIDKTFRVLMDSTGAPASTIREVKKRDEARAKRIQELERQARQEAQAAEAEAYNKMKESPQQGSPMSKFMQSSGRANQGAVGR